MNETSRLPVFLAPILALALTTCFDNVVQEVLDGEWFEIPRESDFIESEAVEFYWDKTAKGTKLYIDSILAVYPNQLATCGILHEKGDAEHLKALAFNAFLRDRCPRHTYHDFELVSGNGYQTKEYGLQREGEIFCATVQWRNELKLKCD